MTTRERIHQIIDELPEIELNEIVRLLESRRPLDPLWHALAGAPIDDEAELEDESEAIEQAYGDVGQGKVVSHDDLLSRLSSPANRG